MGAAFQNSFSEVRHYLTFMVYSQKEINSAKGVIKRRRTNFKKAVEKKAPLFAELIMNEYQDQDPVEHLDNRTESRRVTKEANIIERARDKERIKEWRRQVREICGNDQEFRRLQRQAIKTYGNSYKWRRWLSMLETIKKRLDPLSETADLVFAWIEQETEPVSHWDIWRKRGDGITPKQIVEALHQLAKRQLVKIVGSTYSLDDTGKTAPCAAWQIPK